MGAKRVIDGVHVVPMGMANAFLIEGDEGLTLIDAGFPGKEAALFQAIRGLGRSLDQLKQYRQRRRNRARNQCQDIHAPARYSHRPKWRSFSAYEGGAWAVAASDVQAIFSSRRATGARCHRPAFK
jgi:hypothetical protein